MKYQFDLEEVLDFDHKQELPPDEVVAEIGQQLEKETRGFVKGVVKYTGRIGKSRI